MGFGLAVDYKPRYSLCMTKKTSPVEKIYGIKEAAEYLGLSEVAVRYRVHVSEILADSRVSGVFAWTKQQLDDSRRMADERKGKS